MRHSSTSLPRPAAAPPSPCRCQLTLPAFSPSGGIANAARSFVYSPPPPLLSSPPPPVYIAPNPAPPPPPSPVVGFSAPAKDVDKKGETSFAPGTVTYWETVVAPAPSAGAAAGSFYGRRLLDSESEAYEDAVNQEEQTIQQANGEAAQDAAQAAHLQYAAENMQVQQRNIEANAEAKQAALLVQSQVLSALQAPVPAPAPTPAPAPGASTDMKSREADAGLEGSVASYGRRRLAQTLTSALAAATATSTLEVKALNGYVAQADSDEETKAAQQQSSEQSDAQVNDATDNHQLTSQEASATNQATQKPKIPALTTFLPSPPPVAHKKLKDKEATASMTGSVASGMRR